MLIHVCKSADNWYWHNQYMHEQPVSRNCTFKTKTKDLEGIPLLGRQFGYYSPVGAQKHYQG